MMWTDQFNSEFDQEFVLLVCVGKERKDALRHCFLKTGIECTRLSLTRVSLLIM